MPEILTRHLRNTLATIFNAAIGEKEQALNIIVFSPLNKWLSVSNRQAVMWKTQNTTTKNVVCFEHMRCVRLSPFMCSYMWHQVTFLFTSTPLWVKARKVCGRGRHNAFMYSLQYMLHAPVSFINSVHRMTWLVFMHHTFPAGKLLIVIFQSVIQISFMTSLQDCQHVETNIISHIPCTNWGCILAFNKQQNPYWYLEKNSKIALCVLSSLLLFMAAHEIALIYFCCIGGM